MVLLKTDGKISDVSNLAIKAALTAVENKRPSVSNLVRKADYNTIVTEIENKLNNHNHDKYITTLEFNTLARTNLVTKTDFDAELSILNRKINSNKSKHLLVENELKKLKTTGSRAKTTLKKRHKII